MEPTTATPYVLGPDEGEALWFLGNLVTLKATGARTRGGLTVAEFLNPAGFAPPLHRHLVEDEMFYVLSGSAEFQCNGQTLAAGLGTSCCCPSGCRTPSSSAPTSRCGPYRSRRLLASRASQQRLGNLPGSGPFRDPCRSTRLRWVTRRSSTPSNSWDHRPKGMNH